MASLAIISVSDVPCSLLLRVMLEIDGDLILHDISDVLPQRYSEHHPLIDLKLKVEVPYSVKEKMHEYISLIDVAIYFVFSL